MKKGIYRNIALVTTAFAVAVITMMGVSWWQMRKATPLKTEVMETLRQLSDTNADNETLAEQVRELDLLSRKAYFTQESQLKKGGWILCAMAAVIAFSLRMYYKDTKQLPDKDLDPIDEWLTKSRARRYLGWGVGAIVAIGLIVVTMNGVKERKLAEVNRSTGQQVNKLADDSPESEPTTELSSDSLEGDRSTDQQAGRLADQQKSDSLEEKSDSLKVPAPPPLPKLTWNGFRGTGSTGRSAARGLPTSWNLGNGKNILWQTPVPRHGYNSPVIHGRNIFITGADSEKRELYCFDLWTGELLWTVAATGITGSPAQMPDVSADTGLAASTVATNGKQVCAIFATGDILCTDMEGRRLWAKNLGVPDNHYGFASSPLMYGNTLIIQYDNNDASRLIALSASSGRELWSKSRKDKIAWSSPILAKVGSQQAVIVMGNPAVTAYKVSDGEELWRVECLSGEVGASPCTADGIIYAASEYATCVAIRAADGETLWEAGDCLPECSSPVATKDKLYVATSYGAVCAYDAATGEVVKQHELTTPFYSSPVIADGKVWIFSNSGKCYIFSAGKDFRLITSFDTGEQTFATPAFSDSMMVVRSDKSLYAIKKK
ncbi:MAG: PQQ-binding-like beta-propeller repeat protein [Bacteroidaceae bacterium]|nr:PQQ-binding-like beta-propeller repeat protein [Bacteroidaceae bacterium]